MAGTIGSLIIDIEGKALLSEERELLSHPSVGGIILFARNYDSRAQLKNLCHQIRTARKNPLLIMVDQEGGRVQRFIHEFTRLPDMGAFGKIYDRDPDKAARLANDCGWLMATELLSVDIDLSLAPVLDLNKKSSNAIGNRAFHSDRQAVIVLAQAFIRGMREAGMASTGKHFPGHGSVRVDSHVAIPTDERSLADIERDDMVPFSSLIKAGMTAIMAAHIIFPQIDKLPVGYSAVWLRDILRTQLGFTGPLLSDDLTMEGANISANYSDRVMAAREAGCDFTLLCNNRLGVVQVLDTLPSASQKVNEEKWGALQGKFSQVKELEQEDRRWRETHESLLNLSS
jgi:beta-N-acetylhexosaminidase